MKFFSQRFFLKVLTAGLFTFVVFAFAVGVMTHAFRRQFNGYSGNTTS